uniref:Uncharacterized protein n=1 Tax=Sinocyclocheilus rhinocerous TaxID=307959 RepID=A0A673N362_9TELE
MNIYSSLGHLSHTFSPSFLLTISRAQSGRMDEQRCSINPLSTGHMDNSQSGKSANVEKFFKLIANTQNGRLDDQRATLNRLPEIKSPHGMTAQDSDQLFSSPTKSSRRSGSFSPDSEVSQPHCTDQSRQHPTAAQAFLNKMLKITA